MKKLLLSTTISFLFCASLMSQGLKLNDLEYFECQGVNVLVFSNSFNGGFNDEKNSGIEIIHHGVPIGLGNWAGVNAVLNFGITINYAHLYYPDIVSKDEVYRVPNWPFLWGQNEGTIAGNTQYIIFGSSFKDIVKEKK